MPRSLIGFAAAFLAAVVGAEAPPRPRQSASGSCGMRMVLPHGWMSYVEGVSPTTCTLELRPPQWRPDPECPERLLGRLFVSIVSKPLRTVGGRIEHDWLRAAPECDSGWYAVGEGGSCMVPIGGRASALSAQPNVRLYCNGTYAAQETGNLAVVFGERRVAFVVADAVDDGVFEHILASLRP